MLLVRFGSITETWFVGITLGACNVFAMLAQWSDHLAEAVTSTRVCIHDRCQRAGGTESWVARVGSGVNAVLFAHVDFTRPVQKGYIPPEESVRQGSEVEVILCQCACREIRYASTGGGGGGRGGKDVLFNAFKSVCGVDDGECGTSENDQTEGSGLVGKIALLVTQRFGHLVHDQVHQLVETFEHADDLAAAGKLDADLLIHVLCQIEDRFLLGSFGCSVR